MTVTRRIEMRLTSRTCHSRVQLPPHSCFRFTRFQEPGDKPAMRKWTCLGFVTAALTAAVLLVGLVGKVGAQPPPPPPPTATMSLQSDYYTWGRCDTAPASYKYTDVLDVKHSDTGYSHVINYEPDIWAMDNNANWLKLIDVTADSTGSLAANTWHEVGAGGEDDYTNAANLVVIETGSNSSAEGWEFTHLPSPSCCSRTLTPIATVRNLYTFHNGTEPSVFMHHTTGEYVDEGQYIQGYLTFFYDRSHFAPNGNHIPYEADSYPPYEQQYGDASTPQFGMEFYNFTTNSWAGPIYAFDTTDACFPGGDKREGCAGKIPLNYAVTDLSSEFYQYITSSPTLKYKYRLRVVMGMRAADNLVYSIANTDWHDFIATPMD
jgi:hypothetical protein